MWKFFFFFKYKKKIYNIITVPNQAVYRYFGALENQQSAFKPKGGLLNELI